MNKIILTHDRVFMSIVGPSGCGKTELLFRMLKGSTFYPRFVKIYYFYKEFQPLFKDMQRVIPGMEFLKYSGFDITKNLSHCLLIYEDSCEEIFNDKEFVKIATTGRHRKSHVIYVKHNLFHQSKWSRTIDLNTTHIILFKSLRDIHSFVMNVLSGVVPVKKKELKKFEKTLRQLWNRKVGKTERLKIIQSPSGNNLIQLIALPCIEYLEQNAY